MQFHGRPGVRRASLFLWIATMFLAGAGSISAQKAPPPAPPRDALAEMNASIDALTRKVWPSVVQILVSSYTAQGGRGDGSVVIARARSSGSGFIIDPEGYIMTNAHVVNGAHRVEVVLPADSADGTLATALAGRTRTKQARIIGIASELDLAVIKVDGMRLPALPLATYTEVRQGETVFAFGSPIGLRNSLSHGLVSAVARQVNPDSPAIYVQTDAPINPGNSGGPLVNIRGEVVGVNTFIMSQGGGNEGLGFAIPSATARTAFRQLKQYGTLRRQEIGISMQTITPTMAAALKLPRDYGVIVSDVWPGSPAAAAGLEVGDILVTMDGQAADNLPTISYNFRLRDAPDPVQLVVLRGGAERRLAITAVEHRSDLDGLTGMADPEKSLVAELGILGVEIDQRIAASATQLRGPQGIIVVARAAGATSEVPLLPGDVVRSVNNQPTVTLQSARELMRALKPGTPVTLQIQREGKLMYVTFTID
jgi:serine protease Do